MKDHLESPFHFGRSVLWAIVKHVNYSSCLPKNLILTVLWSEILSYSSNRWHISGTVGMAELRPERLAETVLQAVTSYINSYPTSTLSRIDVVIPDSRIVQEVADCMKNCLEQRSRWQSPSNSPISDWLTGSSPGWSLSGAGERLSLYEMQRVAE